ncbi:hypothetical protein [Pseudoduganella flava]|uniref:Uncharacterized protein n=1 Tax=Pseudoduganella flava TaxID=871742 RepID=A0ABX6FR68_9BURK|nr:hypothetical protein [Pseudoduganella flava]QGZ39828.1 hypothetical protein GO485_12720 [Pseudoduganella flava]
MEQLDLSRVTDRARHARPTTGLARLSDPVWSLLPKNYRTGDGFGTEEVEEIRKKDRGAIRKPTGLPNAVQSRP